MVSAFSLEEVTQSRSSITEEEGRKITTMKMSVHLFLLFSLLSSMATSTYAGGNYSMQWCIVDEQTPDDILQMALDWACGKGGADCSMIQKHRPCYLPNTVKDHASYAFNSYWQKTKKHGGSCYFNSAAIVTELDPSHGHCKFDSVP